MRPLRSIQNPYFPRSPSASFHFDPTFAPAGKTAVTCFLPTRNLAFWVELQRHDPPHYQAEKRRIAEATIAIMKMMAPDFRNGIETTVIRYTRNWRGSMEGWLLTPAMGYKPRNTLPGLRRFAGMSGAVYSHKPSGTFREFGLHANGRSSSAPVVKFGSVCSR
jgi:phytoene dehydrogenase-like protein